MTELISRQAALAEIDKNRDALLSSGMKGAEHILVHYGRRVIEELSTIDVTDTNVGDLISRQAVLMSLADYQLQESPNWGANGMGNTDAYEAITECIRVIEQAPTIDPVKYGKWMVAPPICEAQSFDECKCSVCGVIECFNVGWKKFNYCPNCGARMSEVDDECAD